MDLINKLIEFISTNPGMAAIAWLATIISLVLAIVIPIGTRKNKKLLFKYTTTQLVEAEVAKVNNIQVLFNNKPIEKLSVTICLIQNFGNTTVKAEQIYEGHELKIIAPDVTIISVNVEEVSRDIVTDEKTIKPINHAKGTRRLNINDIKNVNPDDEYGLIPISFKVFEKKDFMVLHIYHTGDSETSFDLAGIGEELGIINKNIQYDELKRIMYEVGPFFPFSPHKIALYIVEKIYNL